MMIDNIVQLRPMRSARTTETDRTDVLAIREDLREGRISNTVARTLLECANVQLRHLRKGVE